MPHSFPDMPSAPSKAAAASAGTAGICLPFPRGEACYISEKHLTQSFRMHLKRIGLDEDLYELVKYSLKECLGDEQEYHKTEIERITSEIEQCKEILKKMYLDQVNNVLDYNMWINLKNEYEVKLNRLSAEYQKHLYANTNFLDTGLKILDLCRKASLPATELSVEEVANIISVMQTVSKQVQEIPSLTKAIGVARENLRNEEEEQLARGGKRILSSMNADEEIL